MMTKHRPSSYQTLVLYLEDNPRVWMWHPVDEHTGERIFQHADEYGRFWFKRADGRLLMLPVRGQCPIAGVPLELGFRSDGFSVAMTGQTIIVEFLWDRPYAT